jgi:hypothetical protein
LLLCPDKENVITKENVMRFNVLTKRVLGVVFGLSLLLGIGMTASTTGAVSGFTVAAGADKTSTRI